MPILDFYDVKAKKKFKTDKFKIETKKGRKFAIATSPFTGIKAYRILPAKFKK